MALQYLLSPTFQFVNTAGKPMTGGAYLEVYVHGTRNKYFCASDFNGTLHPFRIPLDSLGSNVVLAQDSQAYDVYAYNRYGNLMMSRYNVTPGSGGGGIGGIIYSSDGSVQVIPTENGVDLSVNGIRPTVLKVAAASLGADGQFVFDALQVEGEGLSVDNEGRIRMQPGWYHYDVTVELAWEENPRNASSQISLYTTLSRSVIDFDLSFQHTETIQFSGDVHCVEEGAQMVFGVSGMPTGLVASVTDAGMHSITGKTGDGSRYLAGEGINIDANNYISADLDVLQHKLTAGSNIEIVGDTISATADPQQPADWAATEGVTRILNKPDLDIYATRSEVTTGLAGKQNVISDLSTIRSGAAAGATAVQPSEMDSALAGKQDVINDLSTIRSGAAKGATSVQPADLAPYAVASDVESALAGKQDVIPDLTTIRSGASAGATAVQPATMNSALAGKQDVINDLATIRSGAASGATAVQPATMNAALAGKQNVISDLADIRSGASAGATAVQPADLNTALAGKQDVISDLATIRSGAAAGATAVQPADMASALAGKEDAANKSQTLDPASTTQFPSSAATASFVNSSVATNTATFRGNFKLADLGLTYPATDAQIEAALDARTWPAGVTPTNNDYVYVEIEDPQTTGIDDVVKRFKYDGSAWHYEYTLNNSSFTAAEKAAIDSGIDSAKVAIYDAHVANGDIHVTTAEKATWNAKQDAISDLSTIRSGAAAGATAVQPSEMNTALAAKQDTINDLSTIRSGAAAGATAVQPGDLSAVATSGAYSDLSGTPTIPTVDQTYSASSTNAQSGVAVAQAVAGVNAVPASTSSDADKVLTVDAQGVPGWANAQAPISAGNGVDITNNVVSAKVDGSTIGTNANGELESLVTQTNADWDAVSGAAEILNKPVPKTLTAGAGISITENQSTITITNTATPPTVDETELWSSLPGSTTGNLSEAITNFERVRVYWHYHENGASVQSPCIMEIPVDPSYTRYFLNASFGVANCYMLSLRMDFSNGFASFTVQSGSGVYVGAWGGGGTVAAIPSATIDNCIKGVYKIVGIHRIASN